MTEETRWIARLTPTGKTTVEKLLRLGYSLDVWEIDRGDDPMRSPTLVVAAGETQLSEIERLRLARVERLRPFDALRGVPPED